MINYNINLNTHFGTKLKRNCNDSKQIQQHQKTIRYYNIVVMKRRTF